MRRGVGVKCLAAVNFRATSQGNVHMSRMWKKAAGYGAMIALLALVSCKQSTREGRMEKPIPVSTPAPQKGPESPSPQLAPPTEAEVASALHRVFGDDLPSRAREACRHQR